jgi:Tol biopolymer transport system component
MSPRPGIASFAGALAMSFFTTGLASGQAVVSRLTGPQPWRAASADSDSMWFPERNEMAISADNRWVVFESGANNLVPFDRNRYADVFVFEVATGRIVGITSNPSFTANAWCYDPAISADGRFVVFASNASNLVASDTNDNSDVFLVDRDPDWNGVFDEQPYAFERISTGTWGGEAHGACSSPCVSADGASVLFLSDADDLVDYDTNGANDAFLRDRNFGTIQRVDVDSSGNEANNGCSFADLSADGNVVAFQSYSDNLVANDTNHVADVFVRDLWAGTTECASVGASGRQGNGQSAVFRHCLSYDGSIVAFQSVASNLDADGNGCGDVFLRDRWNQTTLLVSLDSNGVQGDGDSGQPTLSSDGSRVTFVSFADNLAANDWNGNQDVFLRDVWAGTTSLLSASTGGGTSNGASAAATISADGWRVVLSSTSSDLVNQGDVWGFRDVFLSDLTAGTIRYVTDLPAGDPNGPSMLATDNRSAFDHPALSADGRFVAFESAATNLFDGDGNGAVDVLVADRITGSIVPISVTSSGVPGNGRSFHPTISSTGRFIAFASEATTLIASDANGSTRDVLRCDRDPDGNGVFDEGNATVSLESVDSSGIQANGWSDAPSISSDGTRIAFTSTASNLDPADPTSNADVFERDTSTGQTFALSSSIYSDWCDRPSMSSDGSAVTYTRYHFDVWGVLYQQVIEFAPALGGYLWIEDTSGGYPASYAPCNSANGTRVVLSYDAYFYGTSVLEIVEVPSQARSWTAPFAGFAVPTMNASGRQVTIDTTTSLSSNDTNTAHDVYLFDELQREDGSLLGHSPPILVSRSTSGAAGNGDSLRAVPSEDGNLIVFASDASDLVAGDTNGCRDVFVCDRTPDARWLNYGSGYAGPHPIPVFTSDSAPVLGSTITLTFGNSSGIPVNALVFLGVHDSNVALPWGATFLVDLSTSLRFLVPLGAAGGALAGTVPSDPALAGLSIYLQALEYDAAVPHKLSFTPGLELHLGN